VKSANLIVWYSFLAILAYLILTRWSGANALLKTGFAGITGYAEALQGRSRPR